MEQNDEFLKLYEVTNIYKDFEYSLFIYNDNNKYIYSVTAINLENNQLGFVVNEEMDSLETATKCFLEDAKRYNNDLMTLYATMFASVAHKGQKDLAGEDYIRHPMFIRDRFKETTRRTVAVLHDVVEDSNYTLEDLRQMFPKEIVEAVDAITRRKGENFKESDEEYYKRIYKNEIAIDVKIQDNLHNMLFYRLNKLEPSVEDAKRLKAYANHVYDSIMLKNKIINKLLV